MFENNKIFILGFARSGYEAAKFLIKRGNEVLINDGKEESKVDQEKLKELKDMGVKFFFGSHPDDLLDDSYDYLIKNPGVPIHHKYVEKAEKLGVEVINEVEMAYRLLPDDVTLVGITGTNGKTTTTTLTYEIIKEAGFRCHLAGNIGYPLCSFLDKLKSGDVIVMETSCQQLNNLNDFKPHIAVMTNLSEAHVDFFDNSYQKYKDVKTKIFKNQTEKDIAILNLENKEVLEQTKNIKSKKVYFSSKNKTNCYLENGIVYYNDEEVLDTDKMIIVGNHNAENIMAAILVAKEFNISNDVIKKVAYNFKGVEHRLEFSGEVNGVRYYNDTEATNIKCTQIALSSFSKPTIIILGGLERGQDFNDLTPFMKNVKAIIAIGQCRKRVKEYAESLNIPVYVHEFLKDGFKEIVPIAKKGDVVLLSPASASWDQYKECEIRGAEFKKYVSELK
ncbi:MAG: UDP-N-acetylmuramoyl-L-alanine--D-glutamate ligase [Candidatus Aphodocola sp.]